MFYGASVWDPWLIVSQIICIQCLSYVSLGVLLWSFVGVQVPNFSLHFFFDPTLPSFSTAIGWCLVSAFLLNSAIVAGYLFVLVERAKKCLDFSATVYIIHLLFSYLYSGFPTALTWWLLMAMCLAITALLGRTHAVVCGAGVIGVCTAYFLGKKGVKVTVIDNCGVATGASGKAGGFLALDWCDNSPLGSLARASFNLHQLLADELQGEQTYGYRRVNTFGVSVNEGVKKLGSPFSWIDGESVGKFRSIGSTSTTAQVHPQLFTRALMSHAESEFGAEFVKGNVEEVKVDSDSGKVLGVVVDGELLETDTVVIALGPWSGKLKLVGDLTRISGLKAHSIVLKPERSEEIGPHALFLSFTTRDGATMDPEIYPRPTGQVYVCGMSETVEVPVNADKVEPRPEAISVLKRVAGTVSSLLSDSQVEAEQACFLPLSTDSVPLIGKIPYAQGAYVATGHSCWGILNGPATGASLAELIVQGSSGLVDLRAFDPSRFLKHKRK